MFESATADCPFCGEAMELLIDPGADEQEYTEDCWVCCRPIVIAVRRHGEGWTVSVRQEND